MHLALVPPLARPAKVVKSLARFIKVICTDSLGLARVCGVGVALRWLGCVAATFNECRREGNLQPADRKIGPGPFLAKRKSASALLSGEKVLSGIREIWVRDVYLANDSLQISPDAVVVDLGANMGNFTLLALGHGPQVRVVSVEPSRERNELFLEQLRVNGWQDRATLDRCFLGGAGETQLDLLKEPEFQGAEFITAEAFLEKHHLQRIDFLKCDIEGSEFELLHPDSPILAITQQLAIEIHDFAGDRHALLSQLEQGGFVLRHVKHDPEGCIALAAR